MRRLSGLTLSGALLLVLLVVNGLAIINIVTARQNAWSAAQKELDLETEAHARALEAAIATLESDLRFLASSPTLPRYIADFDSDDPTVRRWRRLDAEGTMILFLESHPAVHWAVLRDPEGNPLILVGRRDGIPVLMPPGKDRAAFPAGTDLFFGRWTVSASPRAEGSLDTWIDPAPLLAAATPDHSERLTIAQRGRDDAETGNEPLRAVARVAVEEWSPPLDWNLVRAEDDSTLFASVAEITGRYRWTVVLNIGVIALTIVLGVVAVRHVRRSTRLETERAHDERLRELEREMFHTERLATVGRLAAGVAHEINNPLAGMSNYLALAEEDLERSDADAVRSHMRAAREGLRRVETVVRRLLSLARPDDSTVERFDLRTVVEETARFVGDSPEADDIAIDLETPSQPLLVDGDRVTLGQLMLNLLLNACQLQSGRGRVTVRCTDEDSTARIVVADRGPGIPSESETDLFEPFFSTRDSTGLGLAICRRIVDEHGGRIAARDRRGGGAVFTVELPIAERPDPDRPDTPNGRETR